MNWIKWLSCWWNKTHIYSYLLLPNGKNVRCCVRCGHIVED